MDNTNNQFQGFLFSTVGYKSDRDVRSLIDNLNIEQSFVFINKALEYAHSQGAFTMLETEIISKSISIVNSKILTNDSTGQGGNNK